MLGSKQNVFDDFIAAAEWLIDNRVTKPERLAISGRSNGGLLVGRGADPAARICFARWCAACRCWTCSATTASGSPPLWVPEYGSPEDPEAFKWLYGLFALPPREGRRALPGGAVPHGGLRHPGRSDARPQDGGAPAGGEPRQKRPVLLRLENKAGHGAGKPLAKVIAQNADEWTFLFSQLKRDDPTSMKKTRVIILFGGDRRSTRSRCSPRATCSWPWTGNGSSRC